MHTSSPTLVPVVGATEDGVPVTASVASFDLLVQLRRGVGELLDWVTVEPTHSRQPRLVLTRESAAVLAQAMSELVDSSDR